MADIRVIPHRFTVSTSGGNQDITTAALLGETPKAVLFLFSNTLTIGARANFGMGIGAATGVANQWVTAARAKDARTTGTQANARNEKTGCILLYQDNFPANLVLGSFVQWLTNGVRISWSAAASEAYQMTAIFFAGADLQAHANVFQAAATNGQAVDITAPGFTPHIGLIAGRGDPDFTGENSGANLFYGLFENQAGVIAQRGFSFYNPNGDATSRVNARLDTAYAAVELSSAGGSSFAIEIGSPDAQGFSATSRIANNTDQYGYLVLNFGGGKFKLFDLTTPTSVGNLDVAVGFKPQFAFLGLSLLTATDSTATDDNGGAWGWGVAGAVNSVHSGAVRDAVTTTRERSVSDAKSFRLISPSTSADLIVGDVSSFLTTGPRLNFTTADGTPRKWFGFAVEEQVMSASPSVAEAGTLLDDVWITRDERKFAVVTGPDVKVIIRPPWPGGRKLAELQHSDLLDLQAVLAVNRSGAVSLVLPGGHPALQHLVSRAVLEVWWRDMRFGVPWTPVTYAIVRDIAHTWAASGGEQAAILAVEARAILGWRHVAYPAGQVGQTLFVNMPAETIMKTLVHLNTSGEDTEVGRKRAGELPGVTLEADQARGNIITWRCAWDNLLATLSALSDIAGGDWDLVPVSVPGQDEYDWEFRFYPGQRGTDRSKKITISKELGGVGKITYRESHLDEKTAVIVGGPGKEEDREVIIRNGPDWSAANDIETFVDAKGVETSEGLLVRGDQELAAKRARVEFAFDDVTLSGNVFLRDFFPGDLISGRYANVKAVLKVVQINLGVKGPTATTKIITDILSTEVSAPDVTQEVFVIDAGAGVDTVGVSKGAGANDAQVADGGAFSDAVTVIKTGGSAPAADWYVSTTGSATGAGTVGDPWSLQQALEFGGYPANSIQPGDVVMLRGGTYGTGRAQRWLCKLRGTSSQKIIIRPYPGEHVKLNGGVMLRGEHVRFINAQGADFEVYNSDWRRPDGVVSRYFATRSDIWQYEAFAAQTDNGYGNDNEVINIVIHDAEGGVYNQNPSGGLMYGCIVFNVGNDIADWGGAGNPGADGHGFYMQNTGATVKRVEECITGNSFAKAGQFYGSAAGVGNMRLIGNVLVNNDTAFYGGVAADNVYIEQNTVWARNGLTMIGGTAPDNIWASIRNNKITAKLSVSYVFHGGPYLAGLFTYNRLVNLAGSGFLFMYRRPSSGAAYPWNWNNNAYYGGATIRDFAPGSKSSYTDRSFAGWKTASGEDAASTYTANLPTGAEVEVRPNAYEQGRAHIIIHNWDSANSVNVNLTAAGLQHGDTYEIRNYANYYGDTPITGTFNVASPTIAIDMQASRWSVLRPIGHPVGHGNPIDSWAKNTEELFPRFGVFILRKTNGVS